MQVDTYNQKKILRKDFLKRRSQLSDKEREVKNQKIFNRLIRLSEINNAKNICIYVSKSDEADTICIIEHLIRLGKAVYAPKSDKNSNEMTFYKIDSLMELNVGAFSVLEPSEKNEKYIYSDKNDICIVPALCFDRQGYRLGYGKGYYDRFLNDFNGLKIGICFDEFIKEVLPRFDTDIAVDMIISDVKKYCCKGGK